ncbi:hypothetical protein [Microbacterium sp.]|uniref:hypothetical protein n=1 Tax=Microbacterium sp. TaxID=51671 RepID=UPI0039E3AD4B
MPSIIEPFRYFGRTESAPGVAQALAEHILATADPGRARLAFYADGAYFYGGGYAHWYLVVFDIHTGYGADILDYSNAATLESDYSGIDSPVIELVSSGTRTMVLIPLNDDVEGVLFPIEPDEFEAGEAAGAWRIIDELFSRADHFTDYPVLDEFDYLAREQAAWDDALNSEMIYLDIPDDARDDVAAYVSERHCGYSDPGHVETVWVQEACAALGIALEDA